MRRFVFISLLAFIAVSISLPVVSAESYLEKHKRKVAKRKLLEEGEYDKAMWEYEPLGIGTTLLDLANRAANKSAFEKAAEYYEVYVARMPYGDSRIDSTKPALQGLIGKYLAVLEKIESELDDSRSQSLAAKDRFGELCARFEKCDKAQFRPNQAFFREFISDFPLSVQGVAAALSWAGLFEVNNGKFPPTDILVEIAEHMEKSGVPLERCNAVRLCFVRRFYPNRKINGKVEDIISMLEKVEQTTAIEYIKADCRFKLAQFGSNSREYYLEYALKYPDRKRAVEARKAYVLDFVSEKEVGEALKALEELKSESPEGASFAEVYFALSQLRYQAEDFDKAIELMETAVKLYPDDPFAGMVYCGLGETYEKVGDRAKAAEAYRKAVRAVSVYTRAGIMDASMTANRAYKWLAEYHMEREEYELAFEWWALWKPASWCGTCAMSMEWDRVFGARMCLLKFDAPPAAKEAGIRIPCTEKSDWAAIDTAARDIDLAGIIYAADRDKPEIIWRLMEFDYAHYNLFLDTDRKPAEEPRRIAMERNAKKAIELLAEMPSAKGFLLEKLKCNERGSGAAAIALGMMEDEELVPVVKGFLEKPSVGSIHVRGDYFYSLLLLEDSDEARAFVNKFLADDEKKKAPQRWATRVFEFYEKQKAEDAEED